MKKSLKRKAQADVALKHASDSNINIMIKIFPNYFLFTRRKIVLHSTNSISLLELISKRNKNVLS